MQFVYHAKAGENSLNVDVQEYAHLFKVRRSGTGEVLRWRNLDDDYMYEYKIVEVGKKFATMELCGKKEQCMVPSKILHVGWSVIDPKIIEKTLPMLNEIGVSKVSLVYADFSQKQYKIDHERIQRILINSSQQCGRSKMMEIEVMESVKSYVTRYPHSVILDFCDTKLGNNSDITSILIGPEGGFSPKERSLLKDKEAFGLSCSTILRSETAVVVVSSKILA